MHVIISRLLQQLTKQLNSMSEQTLTTYNRTIVQDSAVLCAHSAVIASRLLCTKYVFLALAVYAA
jgi:hypothetical protein